ncbi:pentatricopeptide repeat (PPR) superfamily protein [Striga asiatica]|uniref:Pentatricopeptide repeat (PPR) superfamily protein n=1 Tax=Striga asiatica TaxID=4170 RepID=A0A5A7Q0K1_STRAF|nr:pentatricopeptide repeat (PPR) superfamily protein [Striga asiatica]
MCPVSCSTNFPTDVFLWKAIIKCYSTHGMSAAVLGMYSEMQRARVIPASNMSNTSHTSSTNRYSSAYTPFEVRLCEHDEEAVVLTSMTPENPARRFLKCPRRKPEPPCRLFEWIDPELPSFQKGCFNKLKAEKDRLHEQLMCKNVMEKLLSERLELKATEIKALEEANIRMMTDLEIVAIENVELQSRLDDVVCQGRKLEKKADYLYDLNWTPKFDDFLINYLLEDKLCGIFVPNADNTESILAATRAFNAWFSTSFTVEYIGTRVGVLEKRHDVFTALKDKAGVQYDVGHNKYHASGSTWDEMLRWDDFSLAYMTEGDPHHNKLVELFHEEPPYVNPLQWCIISNSDDEGKKKGSKGRGKSVEVINVEEYRLNRLPPSRLVPYPIRTDIPRKKQPPRPDFYLGSSSKGPKKKQSIHSQTGSTNGSVNQPTNDNSSHGAHEAEENSVSTACSVTPMDYAHDWPWK